LERKTLQTQVFSKVGFQNTYGVQMVSRVITKSILEGDHLTPSKRFMPSLSSSRPLAFGKVTPAREGCPTLSYPFNRLLRRLTATDG